MFGNDHSFVFQEGQRARRFGISFCNIRARFSTSERRSIEKQIAPKMGSRLSMVVNSDKPLLVAISVRSIQGEPYIVNGRVAQSADIKGESSDPNSRFSIRTGLLNDEQLRRCELLKRHGSTMVELPDGYRGDIDR